jgi:hypothetical protein
MAKETTKLSLKELKENIDMLDHEELQEYIADPGISDPEFLEHAKLRMKEIEKEMISVYRIFLKALKKNHCKYVLNEEERNKIFFTYNRKRFYADLDYEYDFVIIYFLHSIQINKEDNVKYSRLKSAINHTNGLCSVVTRYNEYEDTGEINVISQTTLHFISKNPCFDLELGMVLEDFLMAREALLSLMKRKYHKQNK